MSDETPRRISRDLPCKLDDDEKLELLDQLGSKGKEIQRLEDQIREINATKRPLVKERKKLELQAASGEVTRPIMCELVEHGLHVRIKRTDTGETVEERPMTAAERQGDWLQETEKAVAKGKQKRASGAAGGGDGDNVVQAAFGGLSSAKKGPRKTKR